MELGEENVADEEKGLEITEEQNNEDNSKEQKPKPSISPNKDFYFVW